MKQATLTIEGMSCANCGKHVREALLGLDSVKDAKVDHAAGKAAVRFEKDITDEQFAEAVDDAGYTLLTIIRQ